MSSECTVDWLDDEFDDADETIDLTSIPGDTSDEENSGTDGTVSPDSAMENCIELRDDAPVTVAKFTFAKKYREWKLTRLPNPLAEHLHYSCYSLESKQYYTTLRTRSKRTYVGSSLNPFLGNALFAGEDMEPGQFITLYEGDIYPLAEIKARQKRGRCAEYALYVTKGVVIDALGYPYGGGMANHSCRPNARLRHKYLPGSERAPIGYLQAIRHIKQGQEIEADYGYTTQFNAAQLKAIIASGKYCPCRCLQKNCRKVFYKYD